MAERTAAEVLAAKLKMDTTLGPPGVIACGPLQWTGEIISSPATAGDEHRIIVHPYLEEGQ